MRKSIYRKICEKNNIYHFISYILKNKMRENKYISYKKELPFGYF